MSPARPSGSRASGTSEPGAYAQREHPNAWKGQPPVPRRHSGAATRRVRQRMTNQRCVLQGCVDKHEGRARWQRRIDHPTLISCRLAPLGAASQGKCEVGTALDSRGATRCPVTDPSRSNRYPKPRNHRVIVACSRGSAGPGTRPRIVGDSMPRFAPGREAPPEWPLRSSHSERGERIRLAPARRALHAADTFVAWLYSGAAHPLALKPLASFFVRCDLMIDLPAALPEHVPLRTE